ncbi:hypothetical protein HWV62_42488 [Athelia sp. TMB]|nr:hypothetical protein HWV62_42488 [Athelia sp. TMB]
MSSTIPAKLTKKQKKGLAFRERKQGKQPKDRSKHGQSNDDLAVLEVPIEENQDLASLEVPDLEVQGLADAPSGIVKADGGKGKSKAPDTGDEKVSGKSKKRKREEGEASGSQSEKPKSKKKKGVSGAAAGEAAVTEDKGKQRFILFVGNLKYTTSEDAIKEHFAACDPPPKIRLLTPKPSAPGKPTAKSKGCAFLEFSHRNALQQALKLHQSEIEGRRINVELTAGGGGKGESRLTKVKERNKELDSQRKKHQEKLAKSGKGDDSASALPERPQRFSTTSGLGQAAAGKRTWTVGDVEDDGETHRGGRKHVRGKKGRPAAKVWGTGVNAIPVG